MTPGKSDLWLRVDIFGCTAYIDLMTSNTFLLEHHWSSRSCKKYKNVSSALFPFGYTFSVFYSRRTEQQQRQQSRRGFLNIRKLVPAVPSASTVREISLVLQSRGFIDYFHTKSFSWSFAHCKSMTNTILNTNISIFISQL